MSEVAYTDIRLQNCRHPRLKEALMFPQRSYAPEQKPESSRQETPAGPRLGELLGQKTLEVVFKGLSLLAYPLKALSGEIFASRKVRLVA